MGYTILLHLKFFSEIVFIFMQLPLLQRFYELFFCFLCFFVHVLPFYADLLRLRLRFALSLMFSCADSLRSSVYIRSCGLVIQPEEYTPSCDTNKRWLNFTLQILNDLEYILNQINKYKYYG